VGGTQWLGTTYGRPGGLGVEWDRAWMMVSPPEFGGHPGDDLVVGLVGGDGPVGGTPEQDETESRGGATVSSWGQDATEPSLGLPPGEEGGEGIVRATEHPHELIVGGVAPGAIAGEALESEDESLEERVEVEAVEEFVVDEVGPSAVPGLGGCA